MTFVSKVNESALAFQVKIGIWTVPVIFTEFTVMVMRISCFALNKHNNVKNINFNMSTILQLWGSKVLINKRFFFGND